MIYTDKKQNQTSIKINEVFKKRVRLFVQKVFNLPKVPNNKNLKTLFPKYSDLRNCISWVGIYAMTEDKLEQQEVKPMTLKEAFEEVTRQFSKLNVIETKIDTFMGRSYQFSYHGCTLGRVGYDSTTDRFFFSMSRNGNNNYVSSLAVAADLLLKNGGIKK